ncbi:alpha/beta hydrolase [Paenibacillus sp. 1182]|uniref:alpha/beta fold hydrolase n=1 Tax=Paenibacillus sp. 1182 TaxID=2806565 RepID=UPI0028AE50B6|nr:alpha/beta hydrolase [Paenibacillus sp. 1182]
MGHSKSREWIVMIHGIGGSSSIWFKQIRELRKEFNLILIDLPGHGGNEQGICDDDDRSLFRIARQILMVLDRRQIHAAHFVGISLGTIIIQAVQELSPERVKTMILGGAVERIYKPLLTFLKLMEWIEFLVPYMWLYRMAAYLLMPRKRHAEARRVFIHEAVQLGQKEFFCWYNLLCRELNPFFERKRIYDETPTLYIMGGEDFMFLPTIKTRFYHLKNSQLYIIHKCGHVCNIEREKVFNHRCIDFIRSNDMYSSTAN